MPFCAKRPAAYIPCGSDDAEFTDFETFLTKRENRFHQFFQRFRRIIRPWSAGNRQAPKLCLPVAKDAPYIFADGAAESGFWVRIESEILSMWKTTTTVILMGLAAPAFALPPLHKDPTVVNGFYAIGLADEVRKKCDEIEPRMIRAYSYLRSLERYARKAGYTPEQIEELGDNRAEKERLRARIRADLAKRGASPENPEGYCTVGHEEIAKGSAAGRLLRAK